MNDNKEIQIGFVSADGHASVFAEEINRKNVTDGELRVIIAVPLPSDDNAAENIKTLTALGIECTTNMETFASKIDGIMILGDKGNEHLDLTEQFVKMGKPLFVDKPLEADYDKAKKLVDLCEKHDCPVFTASSLRFTNEIQNVINNENDGKINSAMTYSPYLEKNTAVCGWFYYAIHAVEPLFALLGPECVEVRSVLSNEYGLVAIGTWSDGRLGIARATCKSPHQYGFVVWKEKSIHHAMININTIYYGLYRNIVSFFKTKISPVNIDDSLKVISFMEAANASMQNNGRPVGLRHFDDLAKETW